MSRWTRIAARVHLERLRSGLSQRAFARELGVRQSSLRRVEEEGTAPHAKFLIGWGRSGRSINDLLFGLRRRPVRPKRPRCTGSTATAIPASLNGA